MTQGLNNGTPWAPFFSSICSNLYMPCYFHRIDSPSFPSYSTDTDFFQELILCGTRLPCRCFPEHYDLNFLKSYPHNLHVLPPPLLFIAQSSYIINILTITFLLCIGWTLVWEMSKNHTNAQISSSLRCLSRYLFIGTQLAQGYSNGAPNGDITNGLRDKFNIRRFRSCVFWLLAKVSE